MPLPPSESDHEETLHSRLSNLVVHGDGVRIDPTELVRASEALTRGLAPYRGQRVALSASRAEQVLVALAAAESAGCEIVLARIAQIPAALIESWAVAAVIDVELCVHATGLAAPAEFSFHVLVATSGTTGEPKLARHTIQGLLGRIRPSNPGKQRARWLLTYHPATFGGLQVLLTALTSGAELATSAYPSVADLGAQALAFLPTHVSATPTFWRSFLPVFGDQARSLPLRQITLGGEIADQAILDRLQAAFPGAALTHIYASTEAGALFAVRDGRAGFPVKWLEGGIDGVELRIQSGLLQVRSPRRMLAYVNRATSGVLAGDGWLNTGDLVEQTADRVYFRGREDLMLNVGGAKVRPEEVEEALLALPEVSEARVYGVSNPVTGMIVAAEIVAAAGFAGGDDLRRAILRALRASMDTHKVPRIMKFVDSIAVSAAGKKGRTEP